MEESGKTVVVATGEVPSEENEYWVSVGREMVKESTNLANDVAKHLIVLTTALCTVYLTAGKQWNVSPTDERSLQVLVALPIVMWLLSMLLSMLAIFPKSYNVVSISPDDIKRAKKDAIKRKYRCLKGSMIFLMLGILAMTFAVVHV